MKKMAVRMPPMQKRGLRVKAPMSDTNLLGGLEGGNGGGKG